MAKVDLVIGGNAYTVACRDGEESHLQSIAALVDAKAHDARKSLGGVSEARQLLFASLLLADELDEIRRAGQSSSPKVAAPPADDGADVAMLEDIASALETLALRLERRG